MSTDINEDGLTFEAWLREVDRQLLDRCGFTSEGLADFPAWDNWRDGLSPVEGAFVCAVEYSDMPEDLFWGVV